MHLYQARSALIVTALLPVAWSDEWMGCESFPLLGSAADNVILSGGGGTGNFSITTVDFLGSRSCRGSGDLTWGHHGVYSCSLSGEVKFVREGVWIEAHTLGGLAFGRVLCPHIVLKKGSRLEIALEDLPTKCASVTFNNCATFYDTFSSNGTLLHRSAAPSCNSNPSRSANGPPLSCVGTKCQVPCLRPPDLSDLGACGQQCTADVDCSRCGSTGKCVGDDKVTKICVDAPTSAPKSPQPVGTAIDWPERWAADTITLTYNDFSDKTKTQRGRFYYDFAHLRQLQDFGRTKLLYMSGLGAAPSKFYFIAFGFFCVYVETEDPLTHQLIGIPRPNFMKVCADAHMASYVGRERVLDEWADHYTCSVDYDNQTIAFQSWHSLGLGNTSFGKPLALSAGTTKPTWQAPRLTTTWYKNVATGTGAVPDSLFVPPKVCVRIPASLNAKGLVDSLPDEAVKEHAHHFLKAVGYADETAFVV
jgi:hypothetical protein|eukprot:TRINITY_DN61048_c0_g1_i1.p1 TRINITY_DN61048_c0_g1~~TRINITY_DN61048_c0_g1_i1.p1  ORF type:complete len:476 (-),score=30.41 TRINITY_DN61048_c0_g1_i1:87-1514(-)